MSRSKHPLSRQWNDLHDAAEKGEASESELKQLLTRFNVDVRSPDLGTALHNAARKGNTETVNFLLGAGANPDVQNNHGETPLHEAAQMGRTEAVQLLLDEGANPDARNKRGETPLHLVVRRDFNFRSNCPAGRQYATFYVVVSSCIPTTPPACLRRSGGLTLSGPKNFGHLTPSSAAANFAPPTLFGLLVHSLCNPKTGPLQHRRYTCSFWRTVCVCVTR